MKEKELSHLDENGKASMVDISEKNITDRTAKASALVIFPESVFKQLRAQDFLSKKGSIFQIAEIAGIQAVKKTADLIPLCHQLHLSKIKIDIQVEDDGLKVLCIVKCSGKTGVEMEALTGASVAALTIYDMCKALSHEIVISTVQLEHKSGGKHEFDR